MLQILLNDIVIWISILFGGCCSNVISLEKYLLINDTTYLLTFIQFLLVTFESFINLPNKRFFQIPLQRHFVAVLLYFTTSTLNNLVFQHNVSVPIHIIVKSMGTCFNMLIGYLFYHKRYSYRKILSNLVVIVGVCIVTLSKSNSSGEIDITATDISMSNSLTNELIIGVSLLIVSMITASFLGLYTEVTFSRYGRHWEENLFVIHLLSLPMFLVGYKQLQVEFLQITRNWTPRLMQLLLINCASQLICVKSVNRLAGNMSSLTLNLVLLLRKFASLLISMLFVTREPFSPLESVGCALVFLGLAAYALSS